VLPKNPNDRVHSSTGHETFPYNGVERYTTEEDTLTLRAKQAEQARKSTGGHDGTQIKKTLQAQRGLQSLHALYKELALKTTDPPKTISEQPKKEEDMLRRRVGYQN
jgi:hypothetical protein